MNRSASRSLVFLALLSATAPVLAQDTFDPSWYDAALPHVKVGTVQDGIHALSGADLESIGISIGSLDPASLRLFRQGSEVPLSVSTAVPGTLQPSDVIRFVGFRNDGEDEDYLYNYNPEYRSSRFNSLFTDTTYFWLTWGGAPGLRYNPFTAPAGPESTSTGRDVLHRELDQTYYRGDGINLGNPLYTANEGFYWARIAHNTNTAPLTRTYDAILTNWTTAPTDTAVVRVRLNSETPSEHNVRLQLRLLGGSGVSFVDVDTASWTGLQQATLEARISQDRIPGNGNVSVRLISTNDSGSSIPNNWYLDWIDVDYTRNLEAVSGRLSIAVDAPGGYSFNLSGFAPDSILVLDPSNGVGQWADVAGDGTAAVNVEAAGAGQLYVAQPTSELIPLVVRDTASDLANANNGADYVIIRPAALAASAAGLAEHRSSPGGGGHSVMEVDLQDIFDQFDYGRPTPIAIRRFLRSADEWTTPPEFLVLWGDALYPDKRRPRFPWEVPSFGNTASDGWYAMQNGGINDYSEHVAIGRIPIRTNADGETFVEKIVGYEGTPASRWQKNALYLVGGATDVERRLLQSNALQWASLAAGFPTALDTTNFYKTTTDALDPTFKDAIQKSLKSGASWVTYFGHSAAQTWEIVTDPPAEYDNAGRLPVVLSLGCYTGDFATGTGDSEDARSFSEQLVLDNLNGSIGHWGASSSGTIGASAALSAEVHQSVFVDSIRVLGTALREAKQRYTARFSDPLSVKHALQYGLTGDPALMLSLPVEPEFVLSQSSIAISPVAPIPADSNLTASVTIENYGLAPSDSVLIRLTRVNPDRSVDVEDRLVPPFGLNRIEQFELPINEASVGEHEITVDVDADMRFSEPDELNNTAVRSVTVFATGVTLLEPADYGMVTTTSPVLRVVVERQEAGEVTVVIQLSESPLFEPLNTVESRVSTEDLLVKWSPPDIRDETTYYWRATVDDGADPEWRLARFTVSTAGGSRGWIQRGALFDVNGSDGLVVHEDALWKLRDFLLDVSASSERGGGTWQGQFVVAGERLERLQLGFGLLVIDGKTGGVKSHTSAATYPNDFFDPVAGYDSLAAQAARTDVGDFIFTRTRHLGNKDGLVEIADSIKAIFRDLGSVAIDTLTYRDLWIMMSRKGYPAETREWVEPPGTVNEILRDTTLAFSFGRGVTASPAIGPAKEWGALRWNPQLAHPDNRMYLRVISDKTGTTLAAANNTQPLTIDLSAIDPLAHPTLSLEAEFVDSTNAGTPQLLAWSVEYEPIAELAIDRFRSSVSSDTLQEGAILSTATLAVNLSSSDAETAFVDYYVTDTNNERRYVATDTLGSLAADASTTAEASIPTLGIVGSNVIETRVRQTGFVDAISYNNVSVHPLFVRRDQDAPQLEITIDGETFLPDPDPVVNLQDPALPFVDLRPAVEIVVVDENPFIPLSGDTTIVRVTMDGGEVPFADLTVLPAKKGELLRLLYEPELPPRDTVHTLIVEAFDGTGNPAADNPYQVHFRTQTAVEVEGVYPYPNPMSTSTVFAFRLRGADTYTIDDFRLRIYTISGRLIREFDLIDDPSALESGALRIGWNKLAWDGRDDDGDAVATGVYLYRVFAKNEGEAVDLGAMSKVEKVVVIR